MRVAVLGSTGSIGRQALDVAAAHPREIRVVALSADVNAERLVAQAAAFGVSHVALADPSAAGRARTLAPHLNVLGGEAAVTSLAAHPEVDVVLNALVGSAGLEVTVAALQAGKTLALANKESLVVGGGLVTRLARPGQLVPVDSEHSAIFQCLVGEHADDVTALWLTASGGPFYGRTRLELQNVTAEDALAHPTWCMGPKITIDSATLMNKGLEVIEAHHLFGMPYDAIEVLVHRQSCIHSMVEFADGSVKAQLGVSDMRIPIQYALSHPRRWPSSAMRVDLLKISHLDFDAPDLETFGCLRLALEAGHAGGTAPAAMNAANETAVGAFLAGRCGFLDIEKTVEVVLSSHNVELLESVEQVEEVDRRSRSSAETFLARLSRV
ncbi:MAG: 1-deoxy-D-xylulose-5-phosphate reductoisomerase [Coriobacteriia bacterium]|nr:1-deoxy-D-xylulose-5-phosphate reductoisomerase [Coriobacteriia bacterium]